MKYVDTAGRVEAFQTRQAQASKNLVSKAQKRKLKKEKKIKAEMEKPDSLSELRNGDSKSLP